MQAPAANDRAIYDPLRGFVHLRVAAEQLVAPLVALIAAAAVALRVVVERGDVVAARRALAVVHDEQLERIAVRVMAIHLGAVAAVEEQAFDPSVEPGLVLAGSVRSVDDLDVPRGGCAADLMGLESDCASGSGRAEHVLAPTRHAPLGRARQGRTNA